MSRSLDAEHQPRTLRNKGLGIARGEPQRISRADEASLATRARRKATAEQLERLEGEGRELLTKLRIDRDVASRQTQRDIGNAVALLSKARSKLV